MSMVLAVLFNQLMQHRSNFVDGGYAGTLLNLGSVAKGLRDGSV